MFYDEQDPISYECLGTIDQGSEIADDHRPGLIVAEGWCLQAAMFTNFHVGWWWALALETVDNVNNVIEIPARA